MESYGTLIDTNRYIQPSNLLLKKNIPFPLEEKIFNTTNKMQLITKLGKPKTNPSKYQYSNLLIKKVIHKA